MRWLAQAVMTIGLIWGATMILGCAQPPAEQLNLAQKSVEAARSSGAPDYAKEEWGKLDQELSKAKEELGAQETAFALFRSYSKADEMLKRISEEAKRVETTARTKKEEARTAALNREKEAATVIASVENLFSKAPVGKDRAAVQAIKNDLGGLKSGLGDIHQLIDKGDYLSAEAKAKAVKDKGESVLTEIQHAIETLKRRKVHA